ncbi:MAG TPA: hypothetical protein VNQ76_04930, partial [Planctomicrobium sp.]|nr:hypothetical protein [Planctomicrobium sp.]
IKVNPDDERLFEPSSDRRQRGNLFTKANVNKRADPSMTNSKQFQTIQKQETAHTTSTKNAMNAPCWRFPNRTRQHDRMRIFLKRKEKTLFRGDVQNSESTGKTGDAGP